MKIAICDDSASDRDLLLKYCEISDIVDNMEFHLFSSGKELLNSSMDGKVYDIVFLDVGMSELDGIETGKLLRRLDKNVIIIFVTSYPEFALDAFECEAFHYLVKPLEQIKLTEVLKRAVKRIGMLHKYHIVKVKNQTLRLAVSDIYYIECCRKHIIYHMKNDTIETVGKLSEVYKAVAKFGFFQIHQGYIVNFDKVKCFNKYAVILDDDRSVMVSVRKRADVLLAYSKYVENFTR